MKARRRMNRRQRLDAWLVRVGFWSEVERDHPPRLGRY